MILHISMSQFLFPTNYTDLNYNFLVPLVQVCK